jgi:S-adenosylmethionine hydrolase
MPNRLIAFITDLGVRDDAVGMCKGLMLSISPQSTIVDITHEVTPFDADEAAHYLRDLDSFFPAHTVFCCIVYPETGWRPAIAATNRLGQIFVGPDNGVYSRVLRTSGLDAAYEITNPEVCRTPLSMSFLGRDVIATCAAHIAAGRPLAEVGPRRDDIVWLPDHEPTVVQTDGKVRSRVSLIDKNFGNIWTDVTRDDLSAAGLADSARLRVSIDGDTEEWALVRTFGEVAPGARLAYFNSRERLAFATNRGNLAEEIKAARGLTVEITGCP